MGMSMDLEMSVTYPDRHRHRRSLYEDNFRRFLHVYGQILGTQMVKMLKTSALNTSSCPTLFSLDHPACHQQGPQVTLIGSSGLDQSFGPMMCSPSALAQQSSLSKRYGNIREGAKKMTRYNWIFAPRRSMYGVCLGAMCNEPLRLNAFHGKLPHEILSAGTHRRHTGTRLGAAWLLDRLATCADMPFGRRSGSHYMTI
ncbi:hypothetical protein J3F83DRAFT_734034 [Trichoderma novae-zelandiae]